MRVPVFVRRPLPFVVVTVVLYGATAYTKRSPNLHKPIKRREKMDWLATRSGGWWPAAVLHGGRLPSGWLITVPTDQPTSSSSLYPLDTQARGPRSPCVWCLRRALRSDRKAFRFEIIILSLPSSIRRARLRNMSLYKNWKPHSHNLLRLKIRFREDRYRKSNKTRRWWWHQSFCPSTSHSHVSCGMPMPHYGLLPRVKTRDLSPDLYESIGKLMIAYWNLLLLMRFVSTFSIK